VTSVEEDGKRYEPKVTPHQPSDWHHLAEQASAELDPKKLMSLVDELNHVLEESETSSRQRRNSAAAIE
jgi:hypothetical protein